MAERSHLPKRLGCAYRRTAWILFAAVLAMMPLAAQAQSLVRDAEIEHVLRGYGEPLWKAAGLKPGDIDLYLVNDPDINAFVAGGQNLFINTGTILQLDRPREIIGIMAHETGHISGGHLARSAEGVSNAMVPMIIGTLLGIAAAAGGSPDAAMGAMLGGQQIAERSYLAFTRTQEASADQAGVKFLNATHQSARGMLDVFQGFADDEILSDRPINPFLQSHPLSQERIAALEHDVNASPYADVPEPPDQVKTYNRIRAKLVGFLSRPDQVMRKYPLSDTSINARYARAIAYYRIPDLDKALPEIESIIAEEPENPYFYELKGQMLFENGRVKEAVPAYEQSVRYAPNEPLLKTSLGQALIATDDLSLNKRALDSLEGALRTDPENPLGWHQLAIAYARDGKMGMAELATAERYSREGAGLDAVVHAHHAFCQLPAGSPAWRRAQDIMSTMKAGAPRNKKYAKYQDDEAGDGCTREHGSDRSDRGGT